MISVFCQDQTVKISKDELLKLNSGLINDMITESSGKSGVYLPFEWNIFRKIRSLVNNKINHAKISLKRINKIYKIDELLTILEKYRYQDLTKYQQELKYLRIDVEPTTQYSNISQALIDFSKKDEKSIDTFILDATVEKKVSNADNLDLETHHYGNYLKAHHYLDLNYFHHYYDFETYSQEEVFLPNYPDTLKIMSIIHAYHNESKSHLFRCYDEVHKFAKFLDNCDIHANSDLIMPKVEKKLKNFNTPIFKAPRKVKSQTRFRY